jgi:glycosyltransferase involved in cell wall biosynthesis
LPLRTVLFFRKYRRFHGGHLKVWDYFNHTLAADGYDARVLFDVDSNWDASNPWSNVRDLVVERPTDVQAQAYFVAGRDWQRMEALGLLESDLPIINFIQHTRHAGDWSIQSRYLKRKAIRICVSDEVAQAVESAGSRGRTIVIPNSIDVPVEAAPCEERSVDLLIAGLKQPELAVQAAAALQKPGRTIEILDDHVPREEFLSRIRKARNVLFLPNREEGFYLPALEGMALGTLVVCPDCVGNRGFMNGRNALFPSYDLPSLVEATEAAMTMPDCERAVILEQARETVARHQPMAERAAYSDVLRNLDQLWSEA